MKNRPIRERILSSVNCVFCYSAFQCDGMFFYRFERVTSAVLIIFYINLYIILYLFISSMWLIHMCVYSSKRNNKKKHISSSLIHHLYPHITKTTEEKKSNIFYSVCAHQRRQQQSIFTKWRKSEREKKKYRKIFVVVTAFYLILRKWLFCVCVSNIPHSEFSHTHSLYVQYVRFWLHNWNEMYEIYVREMRNERTNEKKSTKLQCVVDIIRINKVA